MSACACRLCWALRARYKRPRQIDRTNRQPGPTHGEISHQQPPGGAHAARLPRYRPGRDPGRGPHAGHDPGGLRELWFRAAGYPGDRVYRRARQVPARPGPAQRGRVLVPGRRRAVAVAALRSDCAARALCGAELRQAAEALPPLCDRARMAQREAGAGAVPAVHPVRRRHGRDRERRGGRRDLHAGGRYAGAAGGEAGRLSDQAQQPETARRGSAGDRYRSGSRSRSQEAAHRSTRRRQVGPPRRGRRLASAGGRTQGRVW